MTTLTQTVRTYKDVLMSVAILVFCFLAVFVALIPAVRKTFGLLSEMRTLRDKAQLLTEKLTTLDALSEETLRNDLSTVLSAVPADRAFASLFETVEGVAGRTGVTLVDMSMSGAATLATPSATKLSAAEKKLGTRTVPFIVTVNGTLSALEQFITLVPNVRRILRIRTFSLTFPKTERPISIMIEMDGFYEPLPTNLGATNATLPRLSEAHETVIARLNDMPLIGGSSTALPPPFIGKVKENPFAP